MLPHCASDGSGNRTFPWTCPEDEGGRTVGDYDANGHHKAGPRVRPQTLVRMIAAPVVEFAEARDKAPVSAKRALSKAAQRAAAERRGMAGLVTALKRAA